VPSLSTIEQKFSLMELSTSKSAPELFKPENDSIMEQQQKFEQTTKVIDANTSSSSAAATKNDNSLFWIVTISFIM